MLSDLIAFIQFKLKWVVFHALCVGVGHPECELSQVSFSFASLDLQQLMIWPLVFQGIIYFCM